MFNHIKECIGQGFSTGLFLPVMLLLFFVGMIVVLFGFVIPHTIVLQVLLAAAAVLGGIILFIMFCAYLAGLMDRHL